MARKRKPREEPAQIVRGTVETDLTAGKMPEKTDSDRGKHTVFFVFLTTCFCVLAPT